MLKTLLHTQGSLTQALREALKTDITVTIVQQGFTDEGLWQRDVVLEADGIPVVMARSQMVREEAESLPELLNMNDTPLGDWLFQQAPHKKTFEIMEPDQRITHYDLNGRTLRIHETLTLTAWEQQHAQ